MKKKKGLWIFSILMALAFCGQAFAATFYVDDDAVGPGTGTRTNPFPTIQAGIDRAGYGDKVRVASGTYYERIVLKNGVKLIGGSGPPTIDGGDSGSVVTAVDVDFRTLLDGFTITNGAATFGGGMYVENSSVRVKYCRFISNLGESGGGGMYNANSSPRVEHCLFQWNKSSLGSVGAGMYNGPGSSPVVESCTFLSNQAATHGEWGGYEFGIGGGMFNDGDSSATVTDCEFISNFAAQGGAMYNNGATPTLTDCVFKDNLAQWEGGAIFNDRISDATIKNCTFQGNTGVYGGGIYNDDFSSFELVNCTFYGNRAMHSAGSEGGGVYNSANPSIVLNCIFWNNTPSQIANDAGATTNVFFSDVQGGYPGWGNIDADPRFRDPGSENFHLQADSPCIDAGLSSDFYILPTDFEGDPRVVDGDDDGDECVDLGADEYYPDRPLRFYGTFYRWE